MSKQNKHQFPEDQEYDYDESMSPVAYNNNGWQDWVDPEKEKREREQRKRDALNQQDRAHPSMAPQAPFVFVPGPLGENRNANLPRSTEEQQIQQAEQFQENRRIETHDRLPTAMEAPHDPFNSQQGYFREDPRPFNTNSHQLIDGQQRNESNQRQNALRTTPNNSHDTPPPPTTPRRPQAQTRRQPRTKEERDKAEHDKLMQLMDADLEGKRLANAAFQEAHAATMSHVYGWNTQVQLSNESTNAREHSRLSPPRANMAGAMSQAGPALQPTTPSKKKVVQPEKNQQEPYSQRKRPREPKEAQGKSQAQPKTSQPKTPPLRTSQPKTPQPAKTNMFNARKEKAALDKATQYDAEIAQGLQEESSPEVQILLPRDLGRPVRAGRPQTAPKSRPQTAPTAHPQPAPKKPRRSYGSAAVFPGFTPSEPQDEEPDPQARSDMYSAFQQADDGNDQELRSETQSNQAGSVADSPSGHKSKKQKTKDRKYEYKPRNTPKDHTKRPTTKAMLEAKEKARDPRDEPEEETLEEALARGKSEGIDKREGKAIAKVVRELGGPDLYDDMLRWTTDYLHVSLRNQLHVNDRGDFERWFNLWNATMLSLMTPEQQRHWNSLSRATQWRIQKLIAAEARKPMTAYWIGGNYPTIHTKAVGEVSEHRTQR